MALRVPMLTLSAPMRVLGAYNDRMGTMVQAGGEGPRGSFAQNGAHERAVVCRTRAAH